MFNIDLNNEIGILTRRVDSLLLSYLYTSSLIGKTADSKSAK